MSKKWFGVKIVYRTDLEGERQEAPSRPVPDGMTEVEESVVLLQAESLDDALKRAESHAAEVEEALSGGTTYLGQTLRTRWVGMDAFEMIEEVEDLCEVHSHLSLVVHRDDDYLMERFLNPGDFPKEECPEEVFYNTQIDELFRERRGERGEG